MRKRAFRLPCLRRHCGQHLAWYKIHQHHSSQHHQLSGILVGGVQNILLHWFAWHVDSSGPKTISVLGDCSLFLGQANSAAVCRTRLWLNAMDSAESAKPMAVANYTTLHAGTVTSCDMSATLACDRQTAAHNDANCNRTFYYRVDHQGMQRCMHGS